MARKPTILWVGDGGCATGFARVNHSIINNLPEGKYNVHHLAVNYKGDPYPDSKAPLYPAMLGGDLLGMGRLAAMMKALKPDIIFLLNDVWVLNHYIDLIKKENPSQKIVCYFPVDAKPLRAEWCEPIVDNVDIPVAYTKFGKSAITDLFSGARGERVRIIPHGIDTGVFYPIDMNIARDQLNGMEPDDFVVLNANRNQPRKRIDLTIKGFAKFAEDKPKNVKLYLHMGVEDAGYHIIAMCERYNLAGRLLLTSLDMGPSKGVSVERLNLIYNSCNIGLNTSMGEGFGLVPFEHGACGKAQIMPDSSAMSEVYGGRAYLMPIDHYDTQPGVLTEGAVVSVDSVAEGLEHYYQDPDARERDGKLLYDYVTLPKFRWEKIAEKWDALFEEVLS